MSNVRVTGFHKAVALKNPAIFQENTIYAKVLFIKAFNFTVRKLQHGHFLLSFWKFPKAAVFQNASGRLLLNFSST